MIKIYTAKELFARVSSFGYTLPDFHIIGVRSKESIPDKFDDHIYILKDNKIICGPFFCTTNPGQYYLQNLLNPKGAALLCADKQYVNCFTLGLHKGKEALIQCGDLWVYRDNDLDNLAEEIGIPVIAKPECRIDIHRANESFTSIIIGKWSAGCQVIANPKEYEIFLKTCKDTAKSLFTYTLLKEW